jgi:hypothetical protein
MRSLKETIDRADYNSRKASRILLNHLEDSGCLDQATRKIVLDTVNDFKRDLVRFIFDVDSL